MVTQTSSLNLPLASTMSMLENSTSQLKVEYEAQKALFCLQPADIQRMLETQAQKIAEGYLKRHTQIQFSLPERVLLGSTPADRAKEQPIRSDLRPQSTGGLFKRLIVRDSRLLLRQCLSALELSSEVGVATAARLIRFATADTMINKLLPVGQNVVYTAPDDEDIPHLLVIDRPESGFYLPQWIALDEQNQLLVSSIQEAEACLASMQNYMEVLSAAVSLAPYMVADPAFQSRRYGMLGQLVNQGRAMAVYEMEVIIQRLKRRAAAQELNQGLHLSLPYFDDQALQERLWDFVVIPGGWVMFVPAFVVLAAHREKAKVARDPRLSPSTRKHLMRVLESLEKAF